VSANTRNRKDVFAGWGFDVVKTIVAENLDAMPETWTHRLLERAKAQAVGEYRPGYKDGYELTYEYNGYLRSIGRLAYSGLHSY
jgi:hypothetical protein